MKSNAQTVRVIAGRVMVLIIVAVFGGSFALSKLLTAFQIYDDEGYLLLSLKHYLNGSDLYTDIVTQYGPFYYFAQWMFFRVLHFAVTHDGGRLVTLVYWLVSALLAELFVQRISKSLLLGGAADSRDIISTKNCTATAHSKAAFTRQGDMTLRIVTPITERVIMLTYHIGNGKQKPSRMPQTCKSKLNLSHRNNLTAISILRLRAVVHILKMNAPCAKLLDVVRRTRPGLCILAVMI
jgi:hypothetical protein